MIISAIVRLNDEMIRHGVHATKKIPNGWGLLICPKLRHRVKGISNLTTRANDIQGAPADVTGLNLGS